MPAFEIEEQTASVEVHINPLVNWVWFGFGILAIGTGIALLPERDVVRGREAAAKRARDRVAAVDPALAGVAFAQHVETGQDPRLQLVSPKRAKWRTSWRAGAAVVRACRWAVLVRHVRHRAANIDAMLKDGKNEAQILDYYVTT
jgi:hypothetical protein